MRHLLVMLALTMLACGKRPEPSPPPAPAAPAAAAAVVPVAAPLAPYAQLDRTSFNRLAVEHFLPLYWVDDLDRDGAVDPAELTGLTAHPGGQLHDYVADHAFTLKFQAAYRQLVEDRDREPADPRHRLVLAELRQGRSTLLRSDFRALSTDDRAFVRHILAAAAVIERLHARQNGVVALAAEVSATDLASRALFHRNQGPWCQGPATEGQPGCNAIARLPKRISGLYPPELQMDPKFCEALAAHPASKGLLDEPFAVVIRDQDGGLHPQPYGEAYAGDMAEVAAHLADAATALTDPGEGALKAYVLAAAQAFADNRWGPADEAWAKMNATNSKWYLRVAPDEVYFEPCSRKAGFALTLARVDQGSLKWQKVLDPLKNDMEQALAERAGPPYAARRVSFHLPDFIEITLNAGEARSAFGATVGQSLPNWGPVANEGRGRTVAMTNIGTDPDSRRIWEGQAGSLFCAATMRDFTSDPGPLQMSTVLHEAGHNLGPAHEYRVDGKKDGEVFGGGLASTLEELKAQTCALFFTDWLAERGTIDRHTARQAHLADIAWGFGQISSGMVDAEGRPKPYSQLAAIQLGALLQAGAMSWKATEKAHNGQDTGCFEVLQEKTGSAVQALMTQVAGIKARGDKAAAVALRKAMVEDPGTWADLRKVIAERWQRQPRASYVYAVELD